VSPAEAQSNVQLLRDAFERWNAGKWEIDYDSIDPEIELHTPLTSTSGAPYRGHEGFRQWVEEIREQFETWDLRVTEWRTVDDQRVFGVGEIHARGRGSGVELDQQLAWLFSIRDGKLFRYEVFYDVDEGLRAAGVDR
jgi:ketosteroid isomerase-like protein